MLMQIDDPIVSRFVFHPRQEPLSHRLVGISTKTTRNGATIGGYLHLHPESGVLMVFFHGNGEIAADYDDLSRLYVSCGVSFWVVDYRGYGKSSGTPSYTKMFTDAEAIFQDIERIQRVSRRSFDQVVVMGRSLGSASAIFLAATHPERLSALLLDSPFAYAPALIRRLNGPELSAGALYGFEDNIDWIKSIEQHCLIIHGTQDWIIPISESKTLYEACPSQKKKLVKIDGAGHNDLLILGTDTYFAEIKALIESIKRG